jgi:DNA polymerase III delta prime subunit
MEINISTRFIREFIANGNKDPAVEDPLNRAIRFGNPVTIELTVEDLKDTTVNWLVDKLGNRESQAATVLRTFKSLSEPTDTVAKLEDIPGAFLSHSKRTVAPGWVSVVGSHGKLDVYLLYCCILHPRVPRTKDSEGRDAYVELRLANTSEGEVQTNNYPLYFYTEDIPKEGIKFSKLLRGKHGLLTFNKSLLDDYEEQKARYISAYLQYGRQVKVRGELVATNAEDDDNHQNYFRWFTSASIYIADPESSRGKGILDSRYNIEKIRNKRNRYRNNSGQEEITEDDIIDSKEKLISKFSKFFSINEKIERRSNASTVVYPDKDLPYPWDLDLRIFHLESRSYFTVHAKNVSPYRYKDLADKLALDKQSKDLVHILTSDTSFTNTDVIEGKGNGVIVLLMGPPGTGKTLTAEVVSENVQKPLYKISCAELGSTPDEIEKQLGKVLKRVQDWKAVLLLDEADVFVQKRGDDLYKNAIIASLLRQLEYYSGILFLTTNRVDDIDEAILSRCTASVQYTLPKPKQAFQLWQQYGELNNLFVHESEKRWSEEEIEIFCRIGTQKYPRLSGRTIHHLMALLSRMRTGGSFKELSMDEVDRIIKFVPLGVNES